MFVQGFHKTASLAQIGRAVSILGSKSALRGAAHGAATGAVAGAVSAPEGEGISGAAHGALTGGLLGQFGGAAARRVKSMQRLNNIQKTNPNFGKKMPPMTSAPAPKAPPMAPNSVPGGAAGGFRSVAQPAMPAAPAM